MERKPLPLVKSLAVVFAILVCYINGSHLLLMTDSQTRQPIEAGGMPVGPVGTRERLALEVQPQQQVEAEQQMAKEQQEQGQEQQQVVPSPDNKIEWLHIPKAGTSFGNSLLLWACPELEPRVRLRPHTKMDVPQSCLDKFRHDHEAPHRPLISDHVSLVNRTDDELRRVFTLLRSPKTRHASAYHYIHSRDKLATKQKICNFINNSTLLHTARGLQVRMVAGEPLRARGWWRRIDSSDPPSDEMVAEACRRLRLFAFVGISDFWEASVCLFHKMHGGVPHSVEYVNVRKGAYIRHSVREVDCGDVADERLYQCGMEVFEESLRRYPQCREHMAAGVS